MSENSREKDIREQRTDADVEVDAFTKTFVPQSCDREQTRSRTDPATAIVKAGQHSHVEKLSHKKKKRKRNGNLNDNKTDGNPCVVTESKKAKIRKSNNDRMIQSTENVQHANNKKRCSAAVDDSVRKKKKRKFDFDSNKLEAGVVRLKSEPDAAAKVGNTEDSLEMPSTTSSLYDLERLEDSVVDDFVSADVIC